MPAFRMVLVAQGARPHPTCALLRLGTNVRWPAREQGPRLQTHISPLIRPFCTVTCSDAVYRGKVLLLIFLRRKSQVPMSSAHALHAPPDLPWALPLTSCLWLCAWQRQSLLLLTLMRLGARQPPARPCFGWELPGTRP